MKNNSTEEEFEIVTFPPNSTDVASSEILPLGKVLKFRSTSSLESEFVTFRSKPMSARSFSKLFDKQGRLTNEHKLRQKVFRGGVEPEIRADVWCFLFGVFPCHSTTQEREAIRQQKIDKYLTLKQRWQKELKEQFPTFDLSLPDNFIAGNRPYYALNMSLCNGETQSGTCCSEDPVTLAAKIYADRIACSKDVLTEALRYISKDVPRTDRNHPYFQGEGNPHLLELRDGLVAFSLLQPKIGYVQGMNDLLARFLIVFDSEEIAFWCFYYYIVTVQKDFLSDGMLQRIKVLQSLLEVLDADLHHYLHVNGISDLVFCHKWLLLGFQREFSFDEGLKILEILSSHHLELHSLQGHNAREEFQQDLLKTVGMNVSSDLSSMEYNFDLFVASAVLILFRNRIFLCADGSQVFQFVSQLSGQMKLDQVLCEAEKLFYVYCHKSVSDAFLLV